MNAHSAPAIAPDWPANPGQVSFLVTSYNKGAYLSAVLESVWDEARSVGGEIILVDDGSTDGSERVCASFTEAHPTVHYWRQDNRGIYATMNIIAAKARGEWVRFCDSDDPLIPGSTARLMKTAIDTGAGVAFGRGILYGPKPLAADAVLTWRAPPGRVRLHADGIMYLIRSMHFTPSMALYRRDVLQNALPLTADLVSCQDLALLFPVLRRAALVSIDEPVCYSLQGAPNQLSANHALTLQQTIRITQRNAHSLSRAHKRAALLKAANRTRRWLRKDHPEDNSLAMQTWLFGIATGARFGLVDFSRSLDKIAALYERELQPILDKEARPF
jgi:hypothetical protein